MVTLRRIALVITRRNLKKYIKQVSSKGVRESLFIGSNIMSLREILESSSFVAPTTSSLSLTFETSTSQLGVDTTQLDDGTTQLGIDAAQGDDDVTSLRAVEENMAFAIICGIAISVVMTAGSIGNVFVIGAIVASKVRDCVQQQYLLLVSMHV